MFSEADYITFFIRKIFNSTLLMPFYFILIFIYVFLWFSFIKMSKSSQKILRNINYYVLEKNQNHSILYILDEERNMNVRLNFLQKNRFEKMKM